MNEYLDFCTEVLELNEKQHTILKLFLDFRSLSKISEIIGSKPSNMHRSLKVIKEKITLMVSEIPRLQILIDFYTESRFINQDSEITEDYA